MGLLPAYNEHLLRFRPVGNQLHPRATLPGGTPDAEPADQPDHRSGAPARPAASANCSSADSGPSASRARIARHPLGNAARATHAVSAGICLSPSGRSDIAKPQPSRPSQPIDPKANDGTQTSSNSPAESTPRWFKQRKALSDRCAPPTRPGSVASINESTGQRASHRYRVPAPQTSSQTVIVSALMTFS
jgi:hypothetical protein